MLLPCSTYHNLLKIQIHCHASPAPAYLSYIISYHSFPLSQAPTILASSECSVIGGPSGEMLFLNSVLVLSVTAQRTLPDHSLYARPSHPGPCITNRPSPFCLSFLLCIRNINLFVCLHPCPLEPKSRRNGGLDSVLCCILHV